MIENVKLLIALSFQIIIPTEESLHSVIFCSICKVSKILNNCMYTIRTPYVPRKDTACREGHAGRTRWHGMRHGAWDTCELCAQFVSAKLLLDYQTACTNIATLGLEERPVGKAKEGIIFLLDQPATHPPVDIKYGIAQPSLLSLFDC